MTIEIGVGIELYYRGDSIRLRKPANLPKQFTTKEERVTHINQTIEHALFLFSRYSILVTRKECVYGAIVGIDDR